MRDGDGELRTGGGLDHPAGQHTLGRAVVLAVAEAMVKATAQLAQLEPRCTAACPTGAMHKLADGAVVHDDGLCIGCGTCLWNCPYGSISFSKRNGVSQKCDTCIDRRSRGLNPLCVDACPTKSIDFGEWDELVAKYGAGDSLEEILPDAEMTHPSLIVRLPRGWKKGGAK